MLSEGLAPWSLSCLRMFTGAISGRSLWQGNLVSFYLTSLFDACCEGGGFEKILLLSTARALYYNARRHLGTAQGPLLQRAAPARRRSGPPLQCAV